MTDQASEATGLTVYCRFDENHELSSLRFFVSGRLENEANISNQRSRQFALCCVLSLRHLAEGGLFEGWSISDSKLENLSEWPTKGDKSPRTLQGWFGKGEDDCSVRWKKKEGAEKWPTIQVAVGCSSQCDIARCATRCRGQRYVSDDGRSVRRHNGHDLDASDADRWKALIDGLRRGLQRKKEGAKSSTLSDKPYVVAAVPAQRSQAFANWRGPNGTGTSRPPGTDSDTTTEDIVYVPRRLGTDRHRRKADAGWDDRAHPLSYATARSRKADDSECDERTLSYETWMELRHQELVEYQESSESEVLGRIVGSSAESTWLFLGEPGSGKSFLLERWMRWLLSELPRVPKDGMVLPILVRLRRVPKPGPNSEDLAELLWNKAELDLAGTRRPRLYKPIRRARYMPLWLLDGWDEADRTYTEDGTLARLNALPGIKVISCRTAVFRASIESRSRAANVIQETRRFTVLPMNKDEQCALLTAYLESSEHALRLQEKLERNVPLRFIAASPIILRLIAELERAAALTLPGSRSEFYRSALAHRWNAKFDDPTRAAGAMSDADVVLKRLALQLGLEVSVASSTARYRQRFPTRDRSSKLPSQGTRVRAYGGESWPSSG